MMNLSQSLEKNVCHVVPNEQEGSLLIAKKIKEFMLNKQNQKQKMVLGLATGSSVKYVYQHLVDMHKHEGLSFKNVVTFNLDEYYGIDTHHVNSYRSFMNEHLFKHIDIDLNNTHIPNGQISEENIAIETALYEQKIIDAGGIDLQILGIGTNGHIGFNEPGASLHSKTRLVHLANSTRISNANHFGTLLQMPRLAITMGIRTILQAKTILMMAWGDSKAAIIQKALEGDMTEKIPASLLQNHPNCEYFIDLQAAQELARIKTPWLTGACQWDKQLVKKAVINLAQKLQKPILSLTSNDYIEHSLGELLLMHGEAYKINLEVYYSLRDTITGWPGGKNAPLPNHPEREKPFPKKVIIFSPHPDDDIISMGGTFMRLHEQGHDVHIAYQTSGNIAVTDEFVTRFLDFTVGFDELFELNASASAKIYSDARNFIKTKQSPFDKDTEAVRQIKGLIRRCEARATCRYVGLPDHNIHFQNLPFYESGTIAKKPMGEEDIKITMDLLDQVQPHQIFCAGDLADPHGTHKVCIEIIFEAMRRLKAANKTWVKDCWVWMYKGAWQEWNIEEIEMVVPMSPEQVKKKRFGIFIHQSQKDIVPFQGNDSREFWQRAEDRNANTANVYAGLGLTQYAALEAFKRWIY